MSPTTALEPQAAYLCVTDGTENVRFCRNTMDLGGFSLAWLRDLAFCAALEAERDSW